MFSRRRSMNPAGRPSSTSGAEGFSPKDLPPLPPGLDSPSQSISRPQSRSGSPQKSDPYQHHLQQTQSKVRRVNSGKKYPPPIENKAQTSKRPRTSSSGILDRVSSLFGSPSGNATNGMDCVIEDEGEGRDDKSIKPSSLSKIKHISNLIKPVKTRSPPKQKHLPPPIKTASSSNLSASSLSFHPFRSLTHSHSRLAQQALGTLSENGGIEHQCEFLPRTPLTPRTPHTPRTPRSLWYANESDEEDIRRPSGLGHRASISSMPGSPYGGRYPWEVGPELTQEPPAKAALESLPKTNLDETFGFPNVATDAGDSAPVSPVSTRPGGRPRAVSSPTMFVTVGTTVKEKLEREVEKLMILGHWSEERKPDSIPKGQDVRPVPAVNPSAYVEEKASPEVDTTANENEPQVDPQAEAKEISVQQQDSSRNSFASKSDSAEPEQPDSTQERERLMSFSLVHMFPDPPSSRPSRPSSDIGHSAICMPSPPQSPLVAPASAPLPTTSKRASSSTMASVMSTASTATMTSLGANISIISGPFGPPTIAFTATPPTQSPTSAAAPPNGYAYLPPTNGLHATTLATPTTAATSFTFHSFPPSPLVAPIQLPREVLNLALSYLPNKDIASLARVNEDFAAVVRGLLYDTIDLTSLLDDSDVAGHGPMRVRKLLGVLVTKSDLTALVTKFVCREWPEWFTPSPYALNLEHETNELWEQEDEVELGNTFLSATFVLALSRMTGLRELIIPSFHPFLFSSVSETTWSGLKSIEFGNVAMEDEEASNMVTWLAGIVGLEKLSFPRLVETAENGPKTSAEIIKIARRASKTAQRLSIQAQKRCSSCWSPALWNAKAGNGNGNGTDPAAMLTSHTSFPVCNGGCAGQDMQPQEEFALIKPGLERVHPFAGYAPLRTFLPNLRVLHAPPTIASLLAALPAEEQDDEYVENFPRPLEDVTINIDMTLYTGLRPTALVQGLHGLKRFGLRFGERVDRRTVEKMLIAVGAALGSGLEELHVEFVDGWSAGADETLYKIVDTALSRYPDLRRLDLRYLKDIATHTESSLPLTPTETTRIGQWIKHCSRLELVGLLSGSCWRRVATTTSLV